LKRGNIWIKKTSASRQQLQLAYDGILTEISRVVCDPSSGH